MRKKKHNFNAPFLNRRITCGSLFSEVNKMRNYAQNQRNQINGYLAQNRKGVETQGGEKRLFFR